MGEEEKKPEEPKAEEKKPEEPEKKQEEKKKEETAGEKKPEVVEKEQVTPPPPPPPPPAEIVLKVFMHCEGCARKVRRSLKGFPGVEEVLTDCKSHNVVIKGEKADPLKVLERIQRKSHRKVELLSPIPKPPEEKKVPEEEKPKPKVQEKVQEPPIVTLLKIHMHCEACSLEIKKRIQRMKGVESADPDLKNSVVSVKGVYDPEKLVEYVYKRTGKHAVIVKLEAEKKEEKKEEKVEEVEKKVEEVEKEKTGEGEENKEKKEEEEEEAKGETKAEEADNVVPEVKINEYFHNPPSYGMEVYAYPAHPVYPAYPAYFHAYPPQIFSDENPNACTVM
ncbi:heavy metal-associated isoprenylated plant protein 7-like isoform X2 [Vigna radiata var. radiata]|uniref:Heavy metal-associated isoprenylated plant protein 7-like isoform X2 n=1 Tax=Vigna radiata var. radiata TaxID=3916 RepID=A0A1S3U2D2_VIGRR|nr:heavy metal-associated isoprenylated plant protein 7-like isoform X2 [Vigna radiata var. radiata]